MEKKYNVLIVHNEYKYAGGEDTVVANEKRLLEENGHKVILYTRSNKELDSFNKFQKIGLVFTTIYNPRTVKEVKKIIEQESIDIVHVHNTLNLVSPSVYYAAKKMNVPVVQTMHNFRLECMGACFYRDGKVCEDCIKYGNKCAIKHACYRESKVQTLACLISNWCHRVTGIYKKINYISLTEFNKSKLLLWEHNGKPIVNEKQIYVKPNFTYDGDTNNVEIEDSYLFVGRIEAIKGIDKVIEAFEKMSEKKLQIVGSGTEFEKWQQYIADNNVINIQMYGFLSHEEVSKKMHQAKALIVASQWYETFGMIVAEGYANSTPVIVGDIGNVSDIVDDGKTGVKFKYDSVDSLVEAVSRFEALSRTELSQNAYNKYKNEFTAEENYKRLYEIYRDICG